jgi:DNA repair protein RadC
LALLKAFGSVRELRKASVKTITARVPGIGEAQACEIVSALERTSNKISKESSNAEKVPGND